jgi:hypothetical protein
MSNRMVGALFALLVASPLGAAEKDKGLSVSLRALPRVAPAPARIQFSVEIEGGRDEDVHCVSLDWDWGDGSKGSTEGECPPYVAGETKVERFFEAEHEYRRPGRPTVRVRLVREGKMLTTTTVSVVVGHPKGKPTLDIEQR